MKERKKVPVLFFSTKNEDKEAFRALVKSGVPCEFRAAAEVPTPLLIVGYQSFLGSEEILEYISKQS